MSKESKESLFRKIGGGVIIGVLVGHLLKISPLDATHWTWDFLKSCGSILVEKVAVPKWLLGTFILVCALLVGWIYQRIRAAFSEITYLDYREDCFDGITWRWSYDLNGHMHQIRGYCLTCDTTLVSSEEEDRGFEYSTGQTFTTFRCERCPDSRIRLLGDRVYIFARIERQIDRAVRVGDWKKVVEERRKLESAKK